MSMRIVFQCQRGAILANRLLSLALQLRLHSARQMRINAVVVPIKIESDKRDQEAEVCKREEIPEPDSRRGPVDYLVRRGFVCRTTQLSSSFSSPTRDDEERKHNERQNKSSEKPGTS